ncbi:hypothetical protein [Sulfurimonas sp.]|uniref:hypothetical protein n=1 Tax=Sulfurimonas sp. TaxID=2022749 RepID=UPI0035633C9F
MKIKPYINLYYLQVLDDMQNILKNSTPGKRRWTLDPVTGLPDYGMTERSTFPDWSKFFYETTPKNDKIKYCQVNGPRPYEDGYFNGNTKEFLRILRNAEKGYMSNYCRIRAAFDQSVHGYLSEIRDFEEQYGETYYQEELLDECPF